MPKPPPRPDRSPGAVLELVRKGLTAHQAARFDDAVRYYREALARDPRNAAANHLLGVVHIARQNPAEAAAFIARAVAAEPRNAQYLANFGVALNAAGRPAEALEALNLAVRVKPDFAEAHSNRGMVLRALGRLEEAIEAYAKAVALRPNEAGFHFNLANTLEDLGEYGEALDAYRRAAEFKRGYARAHAGASRIARRLGRLDEALAEARTAVAANPREPDAALALGLSHRARDELEAAVSAYDDFLAVQPENADVLFDRAMTVRYAARDKTVDAMSRAFADLRLPPEARARAGFALGKALADIGDHVESVDTFRRANAVMWSLSNVDVDGAVDVLHRLRQAFANIPARLRAAGSADASPIFVVGLPRSGKTTVERLLSRHPGMRPLDELNRFSRLVGRAMPHGIHRLDSLAAESLTGIGTEYMSYTSRLAGAGVRTIDTMPGNFELVGHIRLALPKARIILCERDPLDHCVALYEKLFGKGGFGFTYELQALASYYRAHRQLAFTWHRYFGDSILRVDTAALRAGNLEETGRVLAFCGLPADANASDPIESEHQLGREPADIVRDRAAHVALYQPDLGRYLAEKPPDSGPP